MPFAAEQISIIVKIEVILFGHIMAKPIARQFLEVPSPVDQ